MGQRRFCTLAPIFSRVCAKLVRPANISIVAVHSRSMVAHRKLPRLSTSPYL